MLRTQGHICVAAGLHLRMLFAHTQDDLQIWMARPCKAEHKGSAVNGSESIASTGAVVSNQD